jgi:hypothetical protein
MAEVKIGTQNPGNVKVSETRVTPQTGEYQTAPGGLMRQDTQQSRFTSGASAKEGENPRKAIREARLAKLKVIDGPPKTIKVFAASERLRSSLRHATGAGFASKLDQAVEWPNDSFTHRRLKDGSISLEQSTDRADDSEPDETTNAREQAAVNKPKKADVDKARLTQRQTQGQRPTGQTEPQQPPRQTPPLQPQPSQPQPSQPQPSQPPVQQPPQPQPPSTPPNAA